MMRDRTDVMPRPLALTLMVSSVAGSVFWIGLIAFVVR